MGAGWGSEIECCVLWSNLLFDLLFDMFYLLFHLLLTN